MAWEQRRNGAYYYRKIRDGRRVRSEYVGAGELGQLAMHLDQLERRRRDEERQRERESRECFHMKDRQAIESEREVQRLITTALLASGYHQHRGQWRRKRHGRTNAT